MKLKAAITAYAKLRTSLLVVILDDDAAYYESDRAPFERELAEVNKRIKKELFDQEALFAAPDSPVEATLFFGTKQVKNLSLPEKLRTIAARAYAFGKRTGAGLITFALNGRDGARAVQPIAEGVVAASYEFTAYKSKKSNKPAPAVELLVRPADLAKAKAAILDAEIAGDAMAVARDLVNEPAARIYPQSLAAQAKAVARAAGLECEVLDAKQLVKQGYAGTYAVGKGSQHPPCMIIIRYKPRVKSEMHIGLVGKAVTFDTGGYCLKPPKDMWEMKGDMAGGAAVIATMKAISELKPAVRVTGIIPVAQNALDNTSMLPGDVITAKNGKTVHVDNTDAEGRLILMDALIRAKEEGATHVADIATLTGSVVRALGTSISGIFANDDKWAADIVKAGEQGGELYWQLPLHDEYLDMLKSEIADINNTGSSPNAGSITAALFLREFVDPSLKWAHLDIAGTFLVEKPWKYYGPGATGFGVKTLINLVRNMAAK